MAAPSPRDPPTTNARWPANSAGPTRVAAAAIVGSAAGGGRRKASTVPVTPWPQTSRRTRPNRRSALATRHSSDAVRACGVKSTRSPERRESRPGHSMPTTFEIPAIAATAPAPRTLVKTGNA